MSSGSSPALVLDIPTYRWGLYPVVVAAFCALIILTLSHFGLLQFPTSIALMLLAGVLVLVAISMWYSGYGYPARRIKTIIWRQEGGWLLVLADGQTINVLLSRHSWVTPWVWCLYFEAAAFRLPGVMLWRWQCQESIWRAWLTRLHLQRNAYPKKNRVD